MNIFETTGEVLNALADYFVRIAADTIEKKERFSVALSGGSSPKGLYQLLASPAYSQKVEWSKVDFFFGDERYVPSDHPDSNALMASNTLFAPLNISENQIFSVNTTLAPEQSANNYQQKIQRYFGNNLPKFDLILLGLGDNSHTASLFPYTNVLNDPDPGVKEVFLSDQNVYRITMTAPLINLAHHIVFLVFGAGKAEAVYHILRDPKDYDNYPAQLIQPTDGEVIWFMDKTAASKVS